MLESHDLDDSLLSQREGNEDVRNRSNLFPPLASKREDINTPVSGLDEDESRQIDEIDEIESLCMNCEENVCNGVVHM